MKRPLRIVITTGDPDGVGTEITAKALNVLGAKKNTVFFVWRSHSCPESHSRLLQRKFKSITVSTWPEALEVSLHSSHQLIIINSNLPPAFWIETSARAAMYRHIDAIVTAPISKTSIAQAGMKDIGHTDILKRVTSTKNAFMGFIGEKFNVVLATSHIPLESVQSTLTVELLIDATTHAGWLQKTASPKRRRLAMLGLNPHAGEQGMLGTTEQKVHIPAVSRLVSSGVSVDGPLVPDAAFLKKNWKEYGCYIANYHDQGLIPFKMIHGQDSGIHITLGLPFIRTSVDHGTAKDLFLKNKADPSSMLLAIKWAIKLAHQQENRNG